MFRRLKVLIVCMNLFYLLFLKMKKKILVVLRYLRIVRYFFDIFRILKIYRCVKGG